MLDDKGGVGDDAQNSFDAVDASGVDEREVDDKLMMRRLVRPLFMSIMMRPLLPLKVLRHEQQQPKHPHHYPQHHQPMFWTRVRWMMIQGWRCRCL